MNQLVTDTEKNKPKKRFKKEQTGKKTYSGVSSSVMMKKGETPSFMEGKFLKARPYKERTDFFAR